MNPNNLIKTVDNERHQNPKTKSLDEMYIELATNMSKLSTCSRVNVGAILVSGGRPVLSGYNGTPSGHRHCRDIFLEKYDEYRKHETLSFKEFMQLPEIREEHGKFSRLHEVHAEINIISKAANEGLEVKKGSLYVTHSPCNDCCKSILTAGISEVLFENLYDRETEGLGILLQSGISVIQFEIIGRKITNVYKYSTTGEPSFQE